MGDNACFRRLLYDSGSRQRIVVERHRQFHRPRGVGGTAGQQWTSQPMVFAPDSSPAIAQGADRGWTGCFAGDPVSRTDMCVADQHQPDAVVAGGYKYGCGGRRVDIIRWNFNRGQMPVLSGAVSAIKFPYRGGHSLYGLQNSPAEARRWINIIRPSSGRGLAERGNRRTQGRNAIYRNRFTPTITNASTEFSSHKAKYNPGYVWLISVVAAMGGLLFDCDWVVIGGAKPFFGATLT